MSRATKDLGLIAAAQQTNLYTPNTTFTNDNVLGVLGEFSFASNANATLIQNAGKQGQRAAVPQPSNGDITITYPIKGGGATGSYGECFGLLDACCMSSSEALDVKTWTPTDDISNWKAYTMRHYSGNLSAGNCKISQINNVMFNAKIMFDWTGEEGYAKIEYSGKGDYNGAPTLGNILTRTQETIPVEAIYGLTKTFFGDNDYELLKLEFDLGINIVVTKGETRYALRSTEAIKWSATVYNDSTVVPETLFSAGTTGQISLQWGTSPNVITVATGATAAQIVSHSSSEQDGIETIDLTGIVIGNDLTIENDSN